MKNFKTTACLFCLSPFVLLAQTTAPAQNTKLIDGVAAHVNSHTITIADVMREIPGGLFSDLPKEEREAKLRDVYTATLNAMIDAKLILDEAKASGAQIAPWAIEGRVQEILDRVFKGDRAKLAAELAKEGKTVDEWRKEIEDDMTVQFMRHNNVDRTLVVPPKKIREFYEKNSAEFVTPETVDVSMIILEAFEEAPLAKLGAAILESVAQGVEFARVAQTLDSPEARELGRILYSSKDSVVPAEDLRPELAEALSKIADGAATPLIVLGETGYILKRNATTAQRQVPLGEAWPFIESRLREQLARERHTAWVDMLRKKYYVKTFGLPK